MDWEQYAIELRRNVRQKMESLIPPAYHDRIAYAIAIEETEAWILPMFENAKHDTSSHAQPKEGLDRIIGRDDKLKKKYISAAKKDLDYQKLGKELVGELNKCRKKCYSLDAFCIELESL